MHLMKTVAAKPFFTLYNQMAVVKVNVGVACSCIGNQSHTTRRLHDIYLNLMGVVMGHAGHDATVAETTFEKMVQAARQ